MENENNNNSSLKFILQARQLATSGCYAKAYDMYLMVFEKFPETKTRLEGEVRLLLTQLNEVLIATNKIGDIFYNFERAIDVHPGNIYLLNDIGEYLYKFGYYVEACCHFQKALNLNTGFVAAEKNLNSVKNLLVERWHYRMLNDKVRNEAYRKAIHETIIPIKDSVLDLGTGIGLLSMYAIECKPMAVTAVDSSEIMTEIAKNVLFENEVGPVVLVTKKAMALDYRDIGGKRSLILTELFDAGLFGEKALEILLHAWEYLTSNVGRILPGKAEFFVAGVKSECMSLNYHLSPAAKARLNVPNLIIHVSSNEPYDCEDLCSVKDITYMTESQSILKIDFNNIDDIQNKLDNKDPCEVKLKAKESGEVSLIVGWFNLYLTDKVMLTTNPNAKETAKAWQQAIFYDLVPINVKKNQSIPLQFTTQGGKIALLPEFMHDVVRISIEMIRFLNDDDYMKLIAGCVGTVCIYIGQTTEMSQIDILDLSPFPYFGFLMLKRGIHSLTCSAKNMEDKKFIKKIFKANKIPMSKVTIFLADGISMESLRNLKFNVIFNHMIDLCGELNLEQKDLVDQLQESNLRQGGLILPSKIILEAQIVNSEWFDINNRVSDENVHNYRVGEFFNKYQVSQNIHLDFEQMDFDFLSEPVPVSDLTEEIRGDVMNIPIIKDGPANAIICWYVIELVENGDVVSTNRPNTCIDGIAFLAHPKVAMKKGDTANILHCVDSDGAYKLILDTDT